MKEGVNYNIITESEFDSKIETKKFITRNPPIIRTGCKYTKSNLFSLCLSRNRKELCWRATLEGY